MAHARERGRAVVVGIREGRRRRAQPLRVARARRREVDVRQSLRRSLQGVRAASQGRPRRFRRRFRRRPFDDERREPSERALHLGVLLGGELGESVVQRDAVRGLLEHGRAGPRGAQHDAVDLGLRAGLERDALAAESSDDLRPLGEIFTRQKPRDVREFRAQSPLRLPSLLPDRTKRLRRLVRDVAPGDHQAPPDLGRDRLRDRGERRGEVAERREDSGILVESVFAGASLGIGIRRPVDRVPHRGARGARRGDVREGGAAQDAAAPRAGDERADIARALEDVAPKPAGAAEANRRGGLREEASGVLGGGAEGERGRARARAQGRGGERANLRGEFGPLEQIPSLGVQRLRARVLARRRARRRRIVAVERVVDDDAGVFVEGGGGRAREGTARGGRRGAARRAGDATRARPRARERGRRRRHRADRAGTDDVAPARATLG